MARKIKKFAKGSGEVLQTDAGIRAPILWQQFNNPRDGRLRCLIARVDVQLCNAPIIAFEKGQKIFGEVVAIIARQRADNAEIDGNISRVIGLSRIDKNIAGMHIGVEKIVAKNLGKKDFHAPFGEQFHIDIE